MSLFFWSEGYATWHEVASVAREYREEAGHRYRDGVESAAAFAAMEQAEHGCGREAQIAVIMRTMRDYELDQHG
jgi:hypothetical protein